MSYYKQKVLLTTENRYVNFLKGLAYLEVVK